MLSPSAQKLRDSLLGTAVIGEGGIRFHLRTLLGEGGQGWVYKANYDDPDGFAIVVKMLRQEGLNAESLRRFERETKVLQMLGASGAPNPNIIRFYDHGILQVPSPLGEIALPFIALEYIDGPTLQALIAGQKGMGLPLTQAVPLLKQVSRALTTVHEHRIVHRDLKPSNILLDIVQGQQIAKVTDFGLVKITDLSSKSTATVAGASIGYAPPEQYEMGNNRVGPHTDVFSLATIVFEVVSGRAAFQHGLGDSPLKTVARMLTGERPRLAQTVASLSAELRGRPDVVQAVDNELVRAMSGDLELRHATIQEFWASIEGPLRDAISRTPLSATTAVPPTSASSATTRKSSGVIAAQRDSVMQHSGAPRYAADEPSMAGRAYEGPNPGAVARPSGAAPRFSIIAASLNGDRLRASTLFPEDKTVLALGALAIYQMVPRGSRPPEWAPIVRFDPTRQKPIGISRLSTGEVLVFGEHGMVLAIGPRSSPRTLLPPDPDVDWLGAHTGDGDIVLVGGRKSRKVGVIAELGPRGTFVRNLEGTQRLTAVTRLATGTFIACGFSGDLVHVIPLAMATAGARQSHQDIVWGRTGHLYAVSRTFDGGAYAMGSGGHALSITPPLGTDPPKATLEVVQTTRDLVAVTIDGRGVPWAVGGAARLLVRESGSWLRMPLALSEVNLVGVSVSPTGLVIVAENGEVIEATF